MAIDFADYNEYCKMTGSYFKGSVGNLRDRNGLTEEDRKEIEYQRELKRLEMEERKKYDNDYDRDNGWNGWREAVSQLAAVGSSQCDYSD